MWLVMTSLVWLVVLIAPPACALWVVLAHRSLFDSPAERALLALVLMPLVLLGELFLLTLVPIERPLRALLPGAHLIVVAGCVVYVWRRRMSARLEIERARLAALDAWRTADRPTCLAWIIAGAVLALTLAWGAWNAGDEHDGAMYRLVVAAQPFQDGVPGRIHYHQDFADAYPRTVELLYSWTMLCLGNSVGLHMVNWHGLVVLGLATHVLARRAGLDRVASLRCAALVVSTPMPAYLTGVLYNDLAACAPMVAGAAFAAPPRGRPWSRQDLFACATGLMIGASSKLTIAVAAGLVGLVRTLACMVGDRHSRLNPDQAEPRRVGPAACLTILGLAGVIAFIPYLRSWFLYSSPVWPLRLTVGPFLIFDGPLLSESLMITAKGTWDQRWYSAIYKLFQTTSQDANGSFGLLFAIGVVPCALVFAARTLRRPNVVGLIVGVLFFGVLASPPSSNLRYSLAMLPAGYVILHLVTRTWRARAGPLLLSWVFGALLFVNAVDYARAVVREAVVQFRWGVSITDPARNRRWYEQFQWLHTGIDPRVHAHVHAHVRPGERLAYAVVTLGGFLYDPFYTYAIEYRPLEAPLTAKAWREALHAQGFVAALVHRDSLEDLALREDASWERVYHQTDTAGFRPARIYRRH